MGVTVSSTGGSTREKIEVGMYPARCISVIDLGTQKNDFPQAKYPTKEEIMITFEISELQQPNGEGERLPFLLSKQYTKSLGDRANLTKDLVSWRGRPFTPEELTGFDLENILDKCCQVNIIANSNGNPKINTVTPLMKGVNAIDRVNDLINFDLKDCETEKFAKLFKWIRDYVCESQEVQNGSLKPFNVVDEQQGSHATGEDVSGDEVPF